MSKLIEELSSKNSPNTSSILKRFLTVLVISVFYLICVSFVFGIRSDLSITIQGFKFWIEVTILLLALISSLILFIRLSSYGQEKKINTISFKVFFILWGIIHVYLILKDFNHFTLDWKMIFNSCFSSAFLASAMPTFFLTYVAVKSDLIYPKWISLSILSTSAVLSGLFLHLHCPSNNSVHIFGSHYIPAFLTLTIGAIILKKVLKKN